MPKFDLKLVKDIPVDVPLFIAEKDGKTFYLLGTAHNIPLSVLPEYYHSIIKAAKELILEMVNEPLTEKVLLDVGIITETPGDWFNGLSERARVILEENFKLFLSTRNAPLIPVTRLVPGIGHLICQMAHYKMGVDDSLESFFSPKVYALEKREELSAVFSQNKISLEDLENELINHHDENATSKNCDLYYFYFNYLTGSLIYDPYILFPLAQDEGDVINRNKKWIPRILKYHKELESPSLIAVGFAHLPGETGLLNLLFREGFKISVLNAKGELKPYSTHLVKEKIAESSQLPGYFVKLIGEYAEGTAEVDKDNRKVITYSFDSKRFGVDSGTAAAEPPTGLRL